jgi:hypothetical protein
VILLQRLANLRDLLGTEAHLAGLSAGITHSEDPKGMTLTAGAFLTSGGVMDHAVEQRAAEDAGRRGELGGEFAPFADALQPELVSGYTTGAKTLPHSAKSNGGLHLSERMAAIRKGLFDQAASRTVLLLYSALPNRFGRFT